MGFCFAIDSFLVEFKMQFRELIPLKRVIHSEGWVFDRMKLSNQEGKS